jgi:hypothetical protein
MKRILGPILYAESQTDPETWSFSVNLLLAGADTAKPPPLRLAFRDATGQEVGTVSVPTVAADLSVLEAPWACVSWKWAVRLPRKEAEQLGPSRSGRRCGVSRKRKQAFTCSSAEEISSTRTASGTRTPRWAASRSDDHDIMDGWGSLEELQDSPTLRALYGAAAVAFEAFQLGALRGDVKARRETGASHGRPLINGGRSTQLARQSATSPGTCW